MAGKSAVSRKRALVSSLALFVVTSALVGCSGESEKSNNDGKSGGGDAGESSSGGSSGDTGGSNTSGGSGGSSSGGRGGNSGSGQGGDAGQGGSDTGGSGGACAGDGETTEVRRHGQRAKSSGFSGTDEQYAMLYDVPCASVDDCVDPCTTRGGTTEMCEASICVDSTTDYCLPATVWRNLTALRSEGTDTTDGAELVLVFDPYQDFLLVDDFKLEIPEAAEIVGITATIRRAGGSSMEASDGAVRLIKGGVMGEADRSLPTPWTGPEYANVDYGGPADLWNETWTPADLNSPDFGVALSALYTDTAGNGRAYVDIVYVTVHYRTACE